MSEALEIIHEEDEALPEVRGVAAPSTLFGTTDPAEVIRAATAAAKPLAQVVRDQKLAIKIQGREYVKVEGWTLLGSMLGVFPVTVWTRKLEDGWEARVEARTRAGEVVGAAEHECLRSEKTWANRDDYALRSMAATRATAKALRMPLGFVMQLAGFEATPADEMPRDTGPARDVDLDVEMQVGELLGLSDRLGVREAAENAVEAHRSEAGFGKWVQAQLKKAREAAANAEAPAA